MSDERQHDPNERRPDEGRAPRALVPSALVLVLALVISGGLHVNVYEGLAVLGSLLEARRPLPPAEVSFVVLDEGAPTPPEPVVTPEPVPPTTTDPTVAPPAPAPAERERARVAPPRERPRPVVAPPEPPPPEPPPEVALPVPTPPAPATPPPPPADDRRSIVQQSDDPNVENEDARFLADQARIVEEETMANLRNTLRDDPDPVAAATEESDPESTEEGNDTESESADLREVEGDDRRRVTEHEADQRPAEDTVASTSRRPSDQGSATSEQGGAQSQAGTPSRGQEGGAQARGGGLPPGHDVVVTDRFGTFTVRAPDPQPEGSGPGAGGGARIEGPGQGASGMGRMAGRSGERGGGAQAQSGTRGGEQLGLSYAEFESVFGEDELRREREARLEERRSRSRGHARAAEWNAFRAAIENYTPEVRPGNQTALNAAASPFATFLSDMHRRIHREFADRYIASLGPTSPEGVNDPTLRTTLEISINEDGSLSTVGIVRTSGNTLYDFGAFASVWRAQPFPRPPGVILSGDGRAWLRWHFDRGPRHCGTWNAEPYMLANGTGPVDRGEPPEDAPGPGPGAGDGIEIGPALPAREGSPG